MTESIESKNLALPCRVFLEAQFHSLGAGVQFGMPSPRKFTDFPVRGMEEVCQILGVEDPADFSSHFSSQQFCREKAAGIAPDDLVRTMRILCSERWKHVPRCLDKYVDSQWHFREFEIEDLISGGGDLPPGNVNRATFSELVSTPVLIEKIKGKSGYLNIDSPAEVFFDRFVGIPSENRAGKYRLIDGNHRAMHLARQIFLGNLTERRLKTVVPKS